MIQNSIVNVIEINKEYTFKEEFCQNILKESPYTAERKTKLLLEWFNNFFEYTFIKSSPNKIIIHDIYQEYEKLPRKQYDVKSRKERREQREAIIEKYLLEEVFTNRNDEEIYLSYSRIGQKLKPLIPNISEKTIAYSYVKPVLNKIAKFIPPKDWTWFYSYEPLTKDEVREWKDLFKSIFKKNIDEYAELYLDKIGDEDYITYAGSVLEDKMHSYYEKALSLWKSKHNGDFPVKLYRWVLREEWRQKRQLNSNSASSHLVQSFSF